MSDQTPLKTNAKHKSQANHMAQSGKLFRYSRSAKISQSDSFGTEHLNQKPKHAIELPHLKSRTPSSRSTSPAEQSKSSAISVVITNTQSTRQRSRSQIRIRATHPEHAISFQESHSVEPI